ncbi:MAG: hypothetical protein EA384_17050 [Spirochaetaceae bacterium]|nr:MAG: hypothetical protein EA384_17050 [Spirochaetaceae bacterium]
MLYSLSEFAFVLLFVALAASALLYVRSLAAEQRAAEQELQIAALTEEVDFLNEMLSEKQYGVVPCWRRPDGSIAPLVGALTVHGPHRYTVSRVRDQDELTLNTAGAEDGSLIMETALRQLYAEELAYAAEHNCYLRIAVQNETDSYAHFRDTASVIARTRMVVINE